MGYNAAISPTFRRNILPSGLQVKWVRNSCLAPYVPPKHRRYSNKLHGTSITSLIIRRLKPKQIVRSVPTLRKSHIYILTWINLPVTSPIDQLLLASSSSSRIKLFQPDSLTKIAIVALRDSAYRHHHIITSWVLKKEVSFWPDTRQFDLKCPAAAAVAWRCLSASDTWGRCEGMWW